MNAVYQFLNKPMSNYAYLASLGVVWFVWNFLDGFLNYAAALPVLVAFIAIKLILHYKRLIDFKSKKQTWLFIGLGVLMYVVLYVRFTWDVHELNWMSVLGVIAMVVEIIFIAVLFTNGGKFKEIK